MSAADTDWNAIAVQKLTKVLGDESGRRMMEDILGAMGRPHLQSAADLRLFAERLMTKGGFAAAIGGLLSLHATMHEQERVGAPTSDEGPTLGPTGPSAAARSR